MTADYAVWDHSTGTWRATDWPEYASITGQDCPHTDRTNVYAVETALSEREHVADICNQCDATLYVGRSL